MTFIRTVWKNKSYVLLGLVLGIVVVSNTGPSNNYCQAITGTTHEKRVKTTVEVVRESLGSVVMISIPREGARDIIGTGVIVRDDGLIVTSRHFVVSSTYPNVTLHDGTEYQGTVVYQSAKSDIAFVKISTKKKLPFLVPTITDLAQGESVIAIGHPYGYANSVSTGVVSALNRSIRLPGGDTMYNLIQTSAPLNPGNSGGPLLNTYGELVGINAAMRDGAQCISFSVDAGTVILELRRVGY